MHTADHKEYFKKEGIFLYLGMVPTKFRQPKKGIYLARTVVHDFLQLHKPKIKWTQFHERVISVI